MIKAYDFDATIILTDNNVGKIPDTAYYFDCQFEYEDEHMMLRIMLESHFWGGYARICQCHKKRCWTPNTDQ